MVSLVLGAHSGAGGTRLTGLPLELGVVANTGATLTGSSSVTDRSDRFWPNTRPGPGSSRRRCPCSWRRRCTSGTHSGRVLFKDKSRVY